MSLDNPQPSPTSRRTFLAASATALSMSPLAFSLSSNATTMPAVGADVPVATASPAQQSANDGRVRPFSVRVSQGELTDLQRRISTTKWPSRELVTDASQGVQLATMRELSRHWQSNYDWRKFEARLNALPQFMTTIDGVDIHFIHVRSKHRDAMPVIVTHGWPGSVIEQMKIIDPLTKPTAHGGDASDAFDVVIPSLPGHGFSAKPATLGWDPVRVARAWIVLMKRLG